MLEQRILKHFIDSADLNYQVGPALGKPLSEAVQALLVCVTSGGKILACGTGVSNALARVFAQHCIGRFERQRPELAALALSDDSIDPDTDAGRPHAFARQVRAYGQAGDVLLVLSSSADSAPLRAAIDAAHERDMTVVALTGAAHAAAGASESGDAAGPHGFGTAGPSGISGATGAPAGSDAIRRQLRETDVHVHVPSGRAARVHEVHLLALHCLCDGVDAQLLGEQEALS